MIFLGGTCNESTWREELIEMVDGECFNPVVDDWNEEAQARELEVRANADMVVYVITPKMTGVYSIAEVIDDSNKRPEKTIFCILDEDDGISLTFGQLRSLENVGKMVQRNGGVWISGGLLNLAEHLNGSR